MNRHILVPKEAYTSVKRGLYACTATSAARMYRHAMYAWAHTGAFGGQNRINSSKGKEPMDVAHFWRTPVPEYPVVSLYAKMAKIDMHVHQSAIHWSAGEAGGERH